MFQLQRKSKVPSIVSTTAPSRIPEGFVNARCSEYFEAQSAGLEPRIVHPLAVAVIRELGNDFANKRWSLSSLVKSRVKTASD